MKADGSTYKAGEIFKQPALASTLRAVAKQGTDVIYKGAWGTGTPRSIPPTCGSAGKGYGSPSAAIRKRGSFAQLRTTATTAPRWPGSRDDATIVSNPPLCTPAASRGQNRIRMRRPREMAVLAGIRPAGNGTCTKRVQEKSRDSDHHHLELIATLAIWATSVALRGAGT